ncbi:YSIRK-type signal peptide-containing protein [Limosilactobacillus oris]|nr:YSIRK-type signal peptide-containing protein [Limosilactobacillus oris]
MRKLKIGTVSVLLGPLSSSLVAMVRSRRIRLTLVRPPSKFRRVTRSR